jgi:hypothetical protein
MESWRQSGWNSCVLSRMIEEQRQRVFAAGYYL